MSAVSIAETSSDMVSSVDNASSARSEQISSSVVPYSNNVVATNLKYDGNYPDEKRVSTERSLDCS